MKKPAEAAPKASENKQEEEAEAKAAELRKKEAQRVRHFKHGDYDEFLRGLQNPELVKKSHNEVA